MILVDALWKSCGASLPTGLPFPPPMVKPLLRRLPRISCPTRVQTAVALLVETKDTSDPAAITSSPREHILLRWRRDLKVGDLIDARCGTVRCRISTLVIG